MKWILVFFSAVFFLLSCSSNEKESKKLMVCVASSSNNTMKEMATAFEKKYGVGVEIISGASGRLATQIVNGAPYDIFVSANGEYASLLDNQGRTHSTPVTFGFGAPIIWSMEKKISISDLTNSLGSIAIASPKHAPFGKASMKFLKDNYIYDQVEKRLVYAENISQVNEYVLSKAAVYGFTTLSSILSDKLKGVGGYILLDSTYAIPQSIVVLKNKKGTYSMQNKFMAFVLSSEGKKILIKNGYTFKKQ